MKPKKPTSSRFAQSIVFAMGIASHLHAGSLTWDGADTSTPGAQGGAGTWDSVTTLNWWDGSANVVWPGSGTDNDAVFSGSAGTVTISGGGVTVNDMRFTTTGYTLSGAGTITLNGTTPTIHLDSGLSANIGNNTATVLAGSNGLTKTGLGTLNLNGSATHTFTGGVSVKGGTLGLNFSNLATPTNLIQSGNALSLYGGATLSITGKATGTTAQTFSGTSIYSGNSSINVGTTGTVNLNTGTITQAERGGVVSILNILSASRNVLPTATVSSYIAPWAVWGDSTSGAARWAYVDATGKITNVSGTAGGTNMASVTSATTVYTITGNNVLASDKTAYALQDNDAGSAAVTLGNFNITTNGLSQIRTGGPYTRTFQQGTGTGKIIVGAANELVAMGVNNLTIGVPIADGTAGNSHVTYAGGGTFKLTATNTFSGQLTANSGIVHIDTGGSVNSASSIRVNGGKLLQTNTATSISSPVTLNAGTIDGTGTISSLTVADNSASIVNNGNAGTTALTFGSLSFGGDATVNIRSAGSAGIVVTGALATTPANGSVLINVAAGPAWITGNTYNLLSYGSFSGSIADFTKGTIAGLGARQTASLVTSGNNIALGITGDSARWTGASSANWTTTAVGAPFNWKTVAGTADTEFLVNDDVVFDDTATGSTNVVITDATVNTATVTFNNSAKSYTISGGGIASGTLFKNGSNTVTLNNINTYTGTTTINGGTLQVSGGGAIANNGLVSLANTSGALFQVVGSETIGALTGGGGTGGAVSIDAGQTLTLSSGSQTFAGAINGDGTLTNAGSTQTLTGPLSHLGGVNAASGVLTLGNSSSTFTGATTISTGAGIVVTQNGALGATGAGNGTVVTGTGGAIAGALGFSGGVNYSSAESISGAGFGNTSANGVFAAVQRGFIQSVSGNNTFAGSIEINATGLSRIGTQNGSQLTLAGPITMATGVSGVQILFRPGDTTGDFVTLSNTGNLWDTDTLIFSGNTSGSAGLRLGANNALPTAVSVAGSSSSGAGTTLDMAGFNQSINGLALGPGQLKITNSAASTTSTLTLNNLLDRSNTNTSILDGAGTVALVKQGTFTQSLGATNSYTGTTHIQGGTLQFTKAVSLYNNTAASWTAANITVNSGATLGLTVGSAGEFTPADVATIAGNLTSAVSDNGLKSGSFLGIAITAPTTVSASFTDSSGTGGGAVGLIKTGASTLTLDQPSSYTGGTFLNDGYITASHNTALGAGTITFGTGAERLQLSDGITLANDLVINGGNGGVGNGVIQNIGAVPGETATFSGDITINSLMTSGGHFASQNGGTLHLTGSVTSASAVVSVRSGTVAFSGGGSYANMQVTGTARLAANNGLATNATIDLGPAGATGTLDLAGYNQSLVGITRSTASGAIVGNSSTTADSTLTLTGTSSFAGVIQDSVGGGTEKTHLTVNGPGQIFTLTAANTYSGATTITAGTLAIGTGGSIANSSTIHLASGGTFDVSSGSGNILSSSQSLTGVGIIEGDLTLNGALSIGSSPGTMTFNDNLTLGSTSVSTFEFTSASFGAGTFDLAQSLLGSATFGGTLNLLFDSGETYTLGSSATIFDFGGGYSGNFSTVTFSGLGAGQAASFDGLTGTVTIVPEPRAALIGGLGLLALLRRRRHA